MSSGRGPIEQRPIEQRRIERLRALHGTVHRGVSVGIGDDGAVLDGGAFANGVVASVDAQFEGVHFRSSWVGRGATYRAIGFRAAVAALSDLAAMGATPRAILSSVALPVGVDDTVLEALAAGIEDAARMHGAPVVGGNLSRASELSMTTTVLGESCARPLRRRGAKVGDAVWVTGPLGARALGCRALDAGLGLDDQARAFVEAFLGPVPRFDVGRTAGARAHAGIDVSDGLVADLGHVCDAGGVAARIDRDAVPRWPGHEALAARLGRDPWLDALAGGDDYELLLVGPVDDAWLASVGTRVGEIVPGQGVTIVAEGRELRLGATGFDHFG